MLSAEQKAAIAGLSHKYKGRLSIEQLAEGIAACVRNAEELLDDGRVLLEQRRYARGMSILIATMEEIGKVSVLVAMSRIPTSNQALWAELWRDFRSHESKGAHGFVQTYPDAVRTIPELFLAAAMQQRQLAPISERLRQMGIFVDFHAEEKRWLSPQEVDLSDATWWLNRAVTALSRIQRFRELGLYSVAALRLQNEVYGPINRDRPKQSKLRASDMDSIKGKVMIAHREYFRRALEVGIIPAGTDLTMFGRRVDDLS